MTNPVSYQNQQVPTNYSSGITIHITNPTLNAAPPLLPPHHEKCHHNGNDTYVANPNYYSQQETDPAVRNNHYNNYQTYPKNNNFSQNDYQYAGYYNSNNSKISDRQSSTYTHNAEVQNSTNRTQDLNSQSSENHISETVNTNNRVIEKAYTAQPDPIEIQEPVYIEQEGSLSNPQSQNGQASYQQAYPPQYYLNNYNYIQNNKENSASQPESTLGKDVISSEEYQATNDFIPNNNYNSLQDEQKENLSTSQEIINTIDARVAEQKEIEKNSTKTKIIALTNEYIMSLENYLNNPNTEIRLMAGKEILTRLDEDHDRFDDAALNALLNKMLQDPEKLVRILALSAFSSQLASGNDYTIELLNAIQTNPQADKEDVLEAADILLKMSASTEIRYTPVKQNNVTEEQKAE